MPAQIGMLAGANAHTRNMAGTGSPVSGCSVAPVRVRACQSSASVASPRLPSRKACSFALAASICELLQIHRVRRYQGHPEGRGVRNARCSSATQDGAAVGNVYLAKRYAGFVRA